MIIILTIKQFLDEIKPVVVLRVLILKMMVANFLRNDMLPSFLISRLLRILRVLFLLFGESTFKCSYSEYRSTIFKKMTKLK